MGVKEHKSTFGETHDALNRMKRAHERGTGCHLTAEMIESLSLTIVGSMWNEPDPRLTEEQGAAP